MNSIFDSFKGKRRLITIVHGETLDTSQSVVTAVVVAAAMVA